MPAATDTRWLAIEFRFVAERIEGRLYHSSGEGEGRAFSGWMSLMAAIEATRFAPAHAPSELEVERR